MDKLIAYLKRNLKYSYKSVIFNYKQYICFFAAVLIVQMFFCLLTIASDNNERIEFEYINETYDHHIVLRGLDTGQMLYLVNNGNPVFTDYHTFEIVRMEEIFNVASQKYTYDYYLYLINDPQESYSVFAKRTLPAISQSALGEGSFKIERTPLFTYNNIKAANRTSYNFSCLILTALSVLLLIALYNIRINHYKFRYGIYMSFGADFKKLYSTSVWELITLSCLTFIPAAALSAGLAAVIYSAGGAGISYNLFSVVKILFFNLIIILTASYFPMRVMAVRKPLSLIISHDNSNLISSPRRSVMMFGRKFPLIYELWSTLRFRKYNLRLLISAVSFCSFFISGLYISSIYQTTLDYPQPQYRILYGHGFDSEILNQIRGIDGVDLVFWNPQTISTEIRSHLLLNSNQVKLFSSSHIINPANTVSRVTNSFFYASFTPDMVEEMIKSGFYEFEGDPYSIFNDEKTVIISDAVMNTKKFNFKVGDTVKIAEYTGRTREVDRDLIDPRRILRQQMQFYFFDYEEYTIGAVISNYPAKENFIVAMNGENYSAVTKRDGTVKIASVFLESGLSAGEYKETEAAVYDWIRYYDGASVVNSNVFNQYTIKTEKNTYSMLIIISCLILLISPLIWFFSQILFYLKRENEFDVLYSLGAIKKEIHSLHIIAGAIISVLAFISSIILSFLSNFIIYKIYNVVLPAFFSSSFLIRYIFEMPPTALVLCAAISIACGFFSVYTSYILYEKKRSKKITAKPKDSGKK